MKSVHRTSERRPTGGETDGFRGIESHQALSRITEVPLPERRRPVFQKAAAARFVVVLVKRQGPVRFREVGELGIFDLLGQDGCPAQARVSSQLRDVLFSSQTLKR